MTNRLLFPLLIAVVFALAACAAPRTSSDILQATLYDYSAAVRWNQWDIAAEYLDPQGKPLRALDMDRYRQIRITSYNVRANTQPDDDHIEQVVLLRLINNHTQAEREVIDRQRWRFDKSQRRWLLTTGLPDITESR